MSIRLFAYAALLTLCSAVTQVMGQGTGRLFPAPLSFDEMLTWLEPLELSDAQQQIAAAAHQSYLEQSLALRHGRIADYLEASGAREFGAPDVTRRDIEESVRDHRSLLGAIRRMDDELLDRISTALTDEQQEWVQRLRDRRARARQSVESEFIGFGRPSLRALDLTRHLQHAKLDDATWRAIDAVVRDYESAINAGFRTIAELRLERPLAIFDRRVEQEAELAEQMEAQRDAAERGDVMAELVVVDSAMSAIGSDSRWGETLARLSRRNREALDSLMPLMPAEAFRAVERRYMSQAYQGLRIPRDRLARPMTRWLKANAEADVYEAVVALQDSHQAAWRTGQRRLVEAAEKSNFDGGGLSGFIRFVADEPEPEDDSPSPMEKARADLRTLLDRSVTSFESLTGETVETQRAVRSFTTPGGATLEVTTNGDEPEAVEAAPVVGVFLVEADGSGGGGGQVITMFNVEDDGESDDGGSPVTFRMPSFGDWLPNAIDDALVEALNGDLAASGAETTDIVNVLYQDYQVEWDALATETIEPVETALRRGVGQVDDPTGAFASVRDGAARIDAMEQTWFENIRALTDGEMAEAAVRRCEHRRQFDRAGHAGVTGTMRFVGLDAGGRDEEVDLWELAHESLSDAERALITSELDDWLDDAARLRTESWTARLTSSEEQAATLAKQRAEGGSNASMFFAEPSASGAAELDHALAQHTRAALASALATLSGDAVGRFERAYFDAAYPSIFGEPSALESVFTRAADLNLGQDDASELAALRGTWFAERDAIQRRQVASLRGYDDEFGSESGFGSERFEAYQAFVGEQEAMSFELRNLDERIRQQVRSLLGARAAAVGLGDEEGS